MGSYSTKRDWINPDKVDVNKHLNGLDKAVRGMTTKVRGFEDLLKVQ